MAKSGLPIGKNRNKSMPMVKHKGPGSRVVRGQGGACASRKKPGDGGSPRGGGGGVVVEIWQKITGWWVGCASPCRRGWVSSPGD